MNEDKLVSELSHYLTKFKQKSNRLWVFRCPVCGDSKKSKIKTRGNIYYYKDRYWYKCFNCDISIPLTKFCEQHYPELYRRHVVDSFVRQPIKEPVEEIKSKVSIPIQIPDCIGLQFASHNFSALSFLKSRKIPESEYSNILFIEDINRLLEFYAPLGYKTLNYVSPRLVIPVLADNSLIGYVTRSLQDKDPIRYYNLKVTDKLFIWGQDRIDFQKEVYIVEGVLDALFIPNSLAALSATRFQQAVTWARDKGAQMVTIVLDNEPRNKQIRELVNRFIRKGERIVLLTGYPKDINDIVLRYPKLDISTLLQERTVVGLESQLVFKRWMDQIYD